MRRWQHKARGTQYVELGLASLQSAGPVAEGATLVIYRDEKDGIMWARPHVEFHDGRFVRLGDVPETDFHVNATNSVAVADGVYYLPMDLCPIGVKVLLLNRGGVATLGVVRRDSVNEWRGWFPLPKERKK